MRLSIRSKLFLSLLLATTLVVAGMYGFMQWSFERGFVRFVEARQQERVEGLVTRLADEYEETASWDRLRGDKRRWVEILFADRAWARRHRPPWMREAWHDASGRWPPEGPRAAAQPVARRLELRTMLLDADKSVIFGRAEQVDRLALQPIRSAGRTVGYLGVLPGPPLEQRSASCNSRPRPS